MGSGGGGESTTSAQHSPEMRALQQAALPEIKSMLQLNPLSSYAAWSPRQIAGSNPAYDMLFNQASQMGPALGGLNLIFGDNMQNGSGGMAVPTMGGNTGGVGTGAPMGGQGSAIPPPPPNYQPLNVQDIIQQQIAAQVTPAITQAVNQAAPPRNSILNGAYYDEYGNPHNMDPTKDAASYYNYFEKYNGPFISGGSVYGPDGQLLAS